MKTEVFISLGSNIGDLLKNLETALDLLKKEFGEIKVSGFYKTEPQDYTEQDLFYNCCASFKTELDPHSVLNITRSIEKQVGQAEKEIRFGPRIIDLDIVFYGQRVIDSDDLVIPHKRMHKRAFVLFPMADLNENFVHPLLDMSIKELLENEDIKEQGIIKL